jgi:seryl-tRNA synthetase
VRRRSLALRDRIAALEATAAAQQAALADAARVLPNETHPDAPRGPEANARVVETVGAPRAFDGFEPRDHEAIGACPRASVCLSVCVCLSLCVCVCD